MFKKFNMSLDILWLKTYIVLHDLFIDDNDNVTHGKSYIAWLNSWIKSRLKFPSGVDVSKYITFICRKISS